MSYLFILSKVAERALSKLDPAVRAFIYQKTQGVVSNPYLWPKLKGNFSFLRSFHLNFRGIKYRVIYEIMEKEKKIIVHILGARPNIYEKLKKLIK